VITCSSVWAKFSSTTMAVGAGVDELVLSSRGVYSGLTLTTTRPARRVPNSATGYCSRFGIISATRSPRSQAGPFCSQAAKAQALGVELPEAQHRAHRAVGNGRSAQAPCRNWLASTSFSDAKARPAGGGDVDLGRHAGRVL
jgi:hypothetical protein